MLDIYINAARFNEDYSDTKAIGIDETSISRGHKYISLFCKTKRKFKVTTDSKHNKPIAPNLLARQFDV
jgi:hypothetical protein